MKSISKFATLMLLTPVFAATGPAVYAQPANPMASAAPAAAAAPTGPAITRTPLFDEDLKGLNGMDGVMYITDIPAGLSAARHSHPGYEFNYILKGSVSFQVDGQKTLTLKAGQGMYNARGNIHKVWNPSKTEDARLVAVLIKDKDKPLAIPAP